MNRILLFLTLLSVYIQAVDIPSEHAKKRSFGKHIDLNAQIIQLSNSSQSVMSLVSGHIEKYYVKEGQSIKKGDKVVLIESIMLSQMTANFIAQKQQLTALENNCKAAQNLYDKGMTSLQELNQQSIKKNELLSTLTALKSQLGTLGINTNKLKHATADLIIYAHSDGVVSKILQALHSGVQEDTPIVSLVKEQSFFIQSFLPLEYASKVKIGQKITIQVNGKTIVTHLTHILPEVDAPTQRIVLLSSINEKTQNLYINTYIASRLYFNDAQKYVAVKKSALSFFNNEWVVFLHKEEGHNEHKEDTHDTLEEVGHEEESHEEDKAPYEIRVVNIITQDDEYVAVEGLEEGEEYVSGKSYYVKSMLLKSSLGGHGH